MYNVTQDFLNKIKQDGRQFKATVTIRDTTFNDDDIVSIALDENVNPADSFMLGSTGSSKLELTLMNVPADLILDGANVTTVISLYTGSSFEDVPLGKFWVDEISKNKGIVKLTCYDNMIKLEKAYFSDLTYPASINAVVQEICTKAGVELAAALQDIQINKIDGYTYREAIGFIASFLGWFARFSRAGKLEIASYANSGFTIEADNYFPPLTMNEKSFTIGKLICKVGDTTLTSGPNGNEIQFENPIMTQAQLDSIYSTLSTLSYMPYSMDWQGNQALQAGDKITIIDENSNSYNTLLMQNKLSYAGGLKASAAAVGKTDNAQEFSSSGTMKSTVDRMVVEQANIKVLLAKKATIEDLIATNGRIDNLSSTYATIVNLTAVTGRIGTLETTTAHITNGIIDNATIDVAKVNNLSSTYATIINLTASNGRITTLEATTASINNLLAGNIGATNISAGAIQAGSAIIANGAIASAQIISLDVGKINAGDISTTKFRLVSDSGKLLMSDNTIQISDASRVRVQIGKDASNDYNMYVWDASGNLMFDATGLKAGGIKAKIIRDDMVSDTANINASKIEKESLVTQVNGATTLLKASHVKLDTEAQTLDVAFTSLSSTVTSQGSTITSQGTSITAIQGQITSKIWSTDITTAVNGLQTQIDTHTTEISQNTTDISLKASQSSLDTTNNNVGGLTTRMSTAEASITTNANNITLKVATTTYNSGMATKEGTITKSSTAPSSPTTNMLWLDTSVTPNILKRYTGSAWVKATPSTASEVGAYSSSDGSALAGRMTTAESSITQNADNIVLKVSKDSIVSSINQTAESIKIQASKIGLLGATNIPNLTAEKIVGGLLQSTSGGTSINLTDGTFNFGNGRLTWNGSTLDVYGNIYSDFIDTSGGLAVHQELVNGYRTLLNIYGNAADAQAAGYVSMDTDLGYFSFNKPINVGDATIDGTLTVDGMLKVAGASQMQGIYSNFSSAGSGSSGYICMARIAIGSAYANSPIAFLVMQRGKPCPSIIEILFANSAGLDPGVTSFFYSGASVDARLVKVGIGVWDLYIKKNESYDAISIELKKSIYGTVAISYPNTFASSITPTVTASLKTIDADKVGGYAIYHGHVVVTTNATTAYGAGFWGSATVNYGQTLPSVPTRFVASFYSSGRGFGQVSSGSPTTTSFSMVYTNLVFSAGISVTIDWIAICAV